MLWFRRLFGASGLEFPLLGRWTLNYNDNLVNRKIDLANEDHCGCCSIEDVKSVSTEIEEDYYRPFLF